MCLKQKNPKTVSELKWRQAAVLGIGLDRAELLGYMEQGENPIMTVTPLAAGLTLTQLLPNTQQLLADWWACRGGGEGMMLMIPAPCSPESSALGEPVQWQVFLRKIVSPSFCIPKTRCA